jgi:ADP-ribosylglycohydrolase
MMKDKIYGGILGLCVADALGVPVEFESRESLAKNPVAGMRGYGTYNQPPGTWSDDTSLTLCLLDSLTSGLDYTDIMRKFVSWLNKGEYTPHGKVFDIGIATSEALRRFGAGTEPLMCGGASEYDNGNGSLMRILPLIFYLRSMSRYAAEDEFFGCIHDVSSLTHAHRRSRIACGIYLSAAEELLNGKRNPETGIAKAEKYYSDKAEYAGELNHFQRIFGKGFKDLPVRAIKSSGYVVDTLEAALWCLLNTDDYEGCVLKAVNLGGDTDTVGAVAGGLAGTLYGVQSIPEKWLNQIAGLEYIKKLCGDFCQTLVLSVKTTKIYLSLCDTFFIYFIYLPRLILKFFLFRHRSFHYPALLQSFSAFLFVRPR